MAKTNNKHKKADKAGKPGPFPDKIFAAIFNLSPNSVAITRVADRKLMEINSGFTDLTGYFGKDALGKTSLEVGFWADLKERDAYWALQLKKGVVKDFPFTLRARSGALKQCLISGQLVRLEGRDYVIGIVRDISERKRTEEALRNSQKLESLAVLAGGIAHDFNNLHVGMFGFLELANGCLSRGQPIQAREYLAEAFAVYERASALTRQLMTFAKGGAPVRKIQSVSSVVRNSARFALSGSNISCQFNIAPDLWLCDCDENQISQVINNIVINAQQAMPAGGKIIITAENMTLAFAPRPAGDFVRVSIKDQGVGMPAEVLSRIFNPFFTTKDKGYGLGLTTAYSIVRSHDGWIKVESDPGKGSTFHVFLPAARKPAVPAAAVASASRRGRGSVLVMDDEEYVRHVLTGMLANMNYSAVQARNGEEAVAFFYQTEKSGQPFAVTILDLTVHDGKGGLEALREIRKINPQAVVVAMSGHFDDPVMAKPGDHGFNAGINKPFREQDLAELLTRMIPVKAD